MRSRSVMTLVGRGRDEKVMPGCSVLDTHSAALLLQQKSGSGQGLSCHLARGGQPPYGANVGTAAPGCAVSGLHSDRNGALNPPLKFPQRQFTLHAVPLLAIANLFLQRRKKIKGDIGRLKILWIRVGYVVRE